MWRKDRSNVCMACNCVKTDIEQIPTRYGSTIRICAACKEKLQQQERKDKMTKTQEFKKNLSEGINMGAEYMAAILDCLQENPEIQEMGAQLVEEYLEFLLPAARRIISEGIKTREDAFVRFKNLGLSDELAVKMACGR